MSPTVGSDLITVISNGIAKTTQNDVPVIDKVALKLQSRTTGRAATINGC